MSSLGYGAAGTMRGKKGDEASLWGRRGCSHAQSVPASPRFSANGTDGTWAKLGRPCPVPKEKRGRAASMCWTWKLLLAILFFSEPLLYFFILTFFLLNGKWGKSLIYCVNICLSKMRYVPFLLLKPKKGKKAFVKILNIFTGILGALQDYMTTLEQCVAYISYLHKQIGSWDKS